MPWWRTTTFYLRSVFRAGSVSILNSSLSSCPVIFSWWSRCSIRLFKFCFMLGANFADVFDNIFLFSRLKVYGSWKGTGGAKSLLKVLALNYEVLEAHLLSFMELFRETVPVSNNLFLLDLLTVFDRTKPGDWLIFIPAVLIIFLFRDEGPWKNRSFNVLNIITDWPLKKITCTKLSSCHFVDF